ncbi:MAG: hypothetical protein R3E96_03540 [Planctomycetota bacterium]
MITATILTIIMAMIVGMQREAKNLGELVTTTHRERAAQVVMHRIEQELEFAAGSAAAGWLSSAATAAGTTATFDSSLGIPPTGTLLFEPGTVSEERADYTGLDRSTHTITGMTRGVQCTGGFGHPSGVRAYWAGSAVALEDQAGPPASQWDGQAASPSGPIFFRGDGTGFSFRVPTDPAGGTNYFDATGIRWGSEVAGAPSLNGWSALTFRASRQLTEVQANRDLNLDGDTADTFDVGQIMLLRWDAMANGAADTEVALCPPIVLQEVCNYGADLNNDGFEDPMFLWDPTDGSLRVQLFIVSGTHNGRAQLSRTATTIYLRNGAL